MNPSSAEKMAATRAYFDHRASIYRNAAEHGLWGVQRRREERALLALAGPVAGLAVLDLGCGAGFYARRMADRGARPVVAVDASPAMIAAIDDRRIDGVVGDAATVSLERRFDLVIVAGVLEFVADPAAVLANARRHLAPGGRLLVLIPPDGVGGWMYRRFHRRHGLAISLFSPGRLAELAAACGLRQTARRDVVPYALVVSLEAG